MIEYFEAMKLLPEVGQILMTEGLINITRSRSRARVNDSPFRDIRRDEEEPCSILSQDRIFHNQHRLRR